jgi:hypothetical protein
LIVRKFLNGPLEPEAIDTPAAVISSGQSA